MRFCALPSTPPAAPGDPHEQGLQHDFQVHARSTGAAAGCIGSTVIGLAA